MKHRAFSTRKTEGLLRSRVQKGLPVSCSGSLPRPRVVQETEPYKFAPKPGFALPCGPSGLRSPGRGVWPRGSRSTLCPRSRAPPPRLHRPHTSYVWPATAAQAHEPRGGASEGGDGGIYAGGARRGAGGAETAGGRRGREQAHRAPPRPARRSGAARSRRRSPRPAACAARRVRTCAW